jgi:hypothetical protein
MGNEMNDAQIAPAGQAAGDLGQSRSALAGRQQRAIDTGPEVAAHDGCVGNRRIDEGNLARRRYAPHSAYASATDTADQIGH